MTLWIAGRSVRLRRAYLAELRDRAERHGARPGGRHPGGQGRGALPHRPRAARRGRPPRERDDRAGRGRAPGAGHQPRRGQRRRCRRSRRWAGPRWRRCATSWACCGPTRRPPSAARSRECRRSPRWSTRCARRGCATQLWIEGERGRLSPGVDLAAYRLVQEALTNSLRHAGPPPRAWVTVRHEPGELTVQVEDDGLGPGDRRLRRRIRAVTVWWASASASPSMVDF